MQARVRQKGRREIQSGEVDGLFAFLTVVFGLFVRLFPVLRTDFPLVDGGMFYTMIHDLQAAGYRLPVFTSYNLQRIPFAYPPFALYFTGALNSLTHIPLLTLIRWQPVLVNALTVAVFFLFARRFTQSSTKAWLATLIFALTPNAYWWQIVGGGLTRSFGGLFAFLFAYFAYRVFHDRDDGAFALVGAILNGSLVVLSHLEWALQAAFAGLLFFLLWGRSRRGIRNAALVALAVLALTAFWWVTLVQRFGFQIFYTASTATDSRLLFFLPLFSLQYTGEYTAFIAVFALIGAFVALARKDYFPLLWGIGCLLVDPRGGELFALLPLTFLALLPITDLLAPYLLKLGGREGHAWWEFLDLPLGKLFVAVFAILCLSHAYDMSATIAVQHLSSDERTAMQWVQANTSSSEQFLVLGWESNPTHSSLDEWFPALAQRRSLTTVQGQEWLGDYHAALSVFAQYQACFTQDLACVQTVEQKHGVDASCILLSFEKSGQTPALNPLAVALGQSSLFEQVYASASVRVYCHR